MVTPARQGAEIGGGPPAINRHMVLDVATASMVADWPRRVTGFEMTTSSL